jgi:hypothetical protein
MVSGLSACRDYTKVRMGGRPISSTVSTTVFPPFQALADWKLGRLTKIWVGGTPKVFGKSLRAYTIKTNAVCQTPTADDVNCIVSRKDLPCQKRCENQANGMRQTTGVPRSTTDSAFGSRSGIEPEVEIENERTTNELGNVPTEENHGSDRIRIGQR